MSTQDIYNWLKNLTIDDIVEFGENYEGNDVFAIKGPNGLSCLTINNLDDIEM